MIIKSIVDGDWSNPTTWDANRIPEDGDSIEIFHRVRCEPTMKPIKGAQIRLMIDVAVLDTRNIKFSGVRTNTGLSPSRSD